MLGPGSSRSRDRGKREHHVHRATPKLDAVVSIWAVEVTAGLPISVGDGPVSIVEKNVFGLPAGPAITNGPLKVGDDSVDPFFPLG